jgi:hypothetical protein
MKLMCISHYFREAYHRLHSADISAREEKTHQLSSEQKENITRHIIEITETIIEPDLRQQNYKIDNLMRTNYTPMLHR